MRHAACDAPVTLCCGGFGMFWVKGREGSCARSVFGALVLFVGVSEARMWPLSDRNCVLVRHAALERAGAPSLWRILEKIGGWPGEGKKGLEEGGSVFWSFLGACEPFGGAIPPVPRLRRPLEAAPALGCAGDFFFFGNKWVEFLGCGWKMQGGGANWLESCFL